MQDNEPTIAAMRKLRAWRFIIIIFFSMLCLSRGPSALCTQTKIVGNTTLMGTQTCTGQLVLDQHNKTQSHHGLLKLHLVSKNLRKRRTKSLSGWKRNACYGNACYAGNIKTKFQSTYILAVRRNRRQETVSMPIKYSLK